VRLLVTGVSCSDCGGPVTAFVLPDKVWRDLGLQGWICLRSVLSRLNPAIAAVEDANLVKVIHQEIYRQRRRFKLKRINKYLGNRMEFVGLAIAEQEDGDPTSLTVEQVMGLDQAVKRD
jgi:hypothetical protein